ARIRYSDAGLLRPVGLKPPWRRSCRTASRTPSSLRSGAAASRLRRAASSGGDGVSPSVRGKRVTNARRSRRGWGVTVIMVLLYGRRRGRRNSGPRKLGTTSPPTPRPFRYHDGVILSQGKPEGDSAMAVTCDVLIIGGGVIGTGIAHALARRRCGRVL